MTAPSLRERLEDLLTRLDSPADRTLVQAAIRALAEARAKERERCHEACDALHADVDGDTLQGIIMCCKAIRALTDEAKP